MTETIEERANDLAETITRTAKRVDTSNPDGWQSFLEWLRAELVEALSTVQDAEPGTGERRLEPAEPYRNRQGHLCMLCDGMDAHEHPQLKCSVCGETGLAENMPGHTCAAPTAGANPATGAGCPRCAELEAKLADAEARNRRTICIYCQLTMSMDEPGFSEKMADHVMSCPKNPMLNLTMACMATLAELNDLWSMVGQSPREPKTQWLKREENAEHLTKIVVALNKLLTDADLSAFDALTAERDTLKARVAELEKAVVLPDGLTISYAGLQGRIAELERERDADRTNAEENATDWCKLVDVLIGNAEFTDKGVHIDQQGKALERIRDLIAVEGELGDAKEALQQAEKALEPLANISNWWAMGNQPDSRILFSANFADRCAPLFTLGECRAALAALTAIRKALGKEKVC